MNIQSFLSSFNASWPTASFDERDRVTQAASRLSDSDREAALAGVAPFLAELKWLRRRYVPAGWKYLEEKRWKLLPSTGRQLGERILQRGGEIAPADSNSGDRNGRVAIGVTEFGTASAKDKAQYAAALEYLHDIAEDLGRLQIKVMQAIDVIGRESVGPLSFVVAHHESPSSVGVATPMVAESDVASSAMPDSAHDADLQRLKRGVR